MTRDKHKAATHNPTKAELLAKRLDALDTFGWSHTAEALGTTGSVCVIAVYDERKQFVGYLERARLL